MNLSELNAEKAREIAKDAISGELKEILHDISIKASFGEFSLIKIVHKINKLSLNAIDSLKNKGFDVDINADDVEYIYYTISWEQDNQTK
jgi:hypothetical protein